LQRKGRLDPVGDTDSLLISGMLDSVDVLEIATFLEEQFGIDFADRDFDAGDFDTIDSIARQLDGDGA
jgi:acyl carrier protein